MTTSLTALFPWLSSNVHRIGKYVIHRLHISVFFISAFKIATIKSNLHYRYKIKKNQRDALEAHGSVKGLFYWTKHTKTLACGLLFFCVLSHWSAAGVEHVCGNALWLPSGHDLNCSVPRKRCKSLFPGYRECWSTDDDHTLTAVSAEDFAKGTRNSSADTARVRIDSLCLRHRIAAPSAGPITWLPVQSASPRSQQAAPRLPAIMSFLCNLYFHPNETSLSNLCDDSPNYEI